MTHWRAAFISDVHIGARASQSARLRAWLERNRADRLYVVGDLFDGPYAVRVPDIVETLRAVLTAARAVTFIPGNHDAGFRGLQVAVGSLRIAAQDIYVALDGRGFLVTHGDQFDRSLRFGLPAVGAIVDHYARRWLPPTRVHAAARALSRISAGRAVPKRISEAVAVAGVAGVITGHFHDPGLRALPCGALWADTGDWIHHCSALVETHAGEFKLVRG